MLKRAKNVNFKQRDLHAKKLAKVKINKKMFRKNEILDKLKKSTADPFYVDVSIYRLVPTTVQ